MKDDEHPAAKRARSALLRSLWSRSRKEARADAEAGRAITMPVQNVVPPLQQVLKRLFMATAVLIVTVLIVYLDREGYNDNSDGSLDLLDAAYYATVTLSTTGYGDITPVSDSARFTNIFVITPLRVLFLIILVGTTLEVLTERTRQQVRIHRWRSRTRDHVVVVGYGTKGRHAVQTLVGQGIGKDRIVVVDAQRKTADAAGDDGLVAVTGDATRSETLLKAEIHRASRVIVAPQRDETATLITLTARQLNRHATIVVAVREDENVPLLKQSGADTVVTSSSSAGRLLGKFTASPAVARTLEDLMTLGSGMDLIERPVTAEEAGRTPRECADLVVAVVRDRKILDYTDARRTELRSGDRVITVSRPVPAV
ncbi:potassium channel family protein [Streptomyces chromofuscus]|uniref:Potassium channel family protein n=1 Tax=Streptomyces chromofuscus TaxID=42881 RepID=A0A7M2T019_STRCW|nr:potassium channel family protein [Streptomyces chromofuscus]QOV41926.1 potassium channel family protein [Streptomyces chromofuscus]GGS87184.1 NAD-binding protein of Kef-type K+ transporter [Streptomyces chromofuscus]